MAEGDVAVVGHMPFSLAIYYDEVISMTPKITLEDTITNTPFVAEDIENVFAFETT